MATIRMFYEGENPWFVAEDVYNIIGRNLCEIEEADKKLVKFKSQGGVQTELFLSEPAFYLLLLNGSTEHSEDFWKFLKREVLFPLSACGFCVTNSLQVKPMWERVATIENVTPII